MPGYLLDTGAVLMCAHAGQAQPTAPQPRVKISGNPIVVQSTTYAIAGCALTGTPNPPCATGMWIAGATRITAGGQPALLGDSQSQCVPTGAPMQVMVTQMRVKGQ